MGIISRFKDIMSANINALLDKAEDPSKMIDQYLRNLESDLGKVKAETAAVMAEETRCKRQLDECTAEINKYQNYAMKAVQSLLNGSVLPDKVVLYLTFSQFVEKEIPQELWALAKSNPIFEIRNYDRDIRSYRKLIPALQDFPDAVIVTVDDDVAYHRNMLRDILHLHEQYPDAVLAHRAKRIKLGMPYRKWTKYRWYSFLFKRIHSRPPLAWLYSVRYGI